VTANTLQRVYAWGKGRARALSPIQDIIADSIDAVLPDQRIRELRAVRNAYATAVPDTVTITSDERDWMRGDTIIAQFDTASAIAGADSSRTPPVRAILARIGARAYYHVSNSANRARPGVNYVVGRTIDIAFENRAVHTVTVQERAGGVYLEPVQDSAATAPASPAGGSLGTQGNTPATQNTAPGTAPSTAPSPAPGTAATKAIDRPRTAPLSKTKRAP
jgi:hypothetical protein